MTMSKNIYDALEYPKTCAPDDFWGQVRRTVNGKPIPQEQIDMIFAMIREGLAFAPDDVLLDLCCGNGAVGKEFFDEVTACLGVDMSPCLIEVAQKNFQRIPTHTFLLSTINAYCREAAQPERFTKALWYGAFAYLSVEDARNVLELLRERFTALQRFFIGAIPDAACADTFFQGKKAVALDNPSTAIGRWHTRRDFRELAAGCGWRVEITDMPDAFYQKHYRFTALLLRGDS
jgi:hypothetical protein